MLVFKRSMDFDFNKEFISLPFFVNGFFRDNFGCIYRLVILTDHFKAFCETSSAKKFPLDIFNIINFVLEGFFLAFLHFKSQNYYVWSEYKCQINITIDLYLKFILHRYRKFPHPLRIMAPSTSCSFVNWKVSTGIYACFIPTKVLFLTPHIFHRILFHIWAFQAFCH